MLDFDHAEMYQVETRVLKVKRNIERFPKGIRGMGLYLITICDEIANETT